MAERKEEESRYPSRTKDARAKPVTLLDPYVLYLLRRHDVIPAEPLAEVAGALGSGLTRLTRFLLVFGVLCALPGVIAFVIYLTQVLRTGSMVWPMPRLLIPTEMVCRTCHVRL